MITQSRGHFSKEALNTGKGQIQIQENIFPNKCLCESCHKVGAFARDLPGNLVGHSSTTEVQKKSQFSIHRSRITSGRMLQDLVHKIVH